MKYKISDDDTFYKKEESNIIPKQFDYIECQNCRTIFCENSQFPVLYILSKNNKFVWWHEKCKSNKNYEKKSK